MRRAAIVSVITGGVLATVILAGCESSGSGPSSSGSSSSGQSNGSETSLALHSAEPDLLDNVAVAAPADSGGAKAATATGGTLVADTRALIRTANMTVQVKTPAAVATQANAADALVTKAGGEVFGDSRTNTTDDDATAILTLKVPPAQLTPILNDLSQLGKEQSRSLSSQDVTTQVADVDARLASANASIIRLRSLYSSASKVTDVIAIEDELSTREADLESLQGQQRALSSETVMATVTLTLTTVHPPATKPHRHNHYTGLAGAIANGWHHFTTGGSWLITALVTVVPFVLLIALIAAAGLWARRRRPTTIAPVATAE